jgi:hypothetical protein
MTNLERQQDEQVRQRIIRLFAQDILSIIGKSLRRDAEDQLMIREAITREDLEEAEFRERAEQIAIEQAPLIAEEQLYKLFGQCPLLN